MIRILAFLIAFLPGLALAGNLPTRDNPYVNDNMDLLSTSAKTALSLKLAGLHLRDGVEMAVLTTSSRKDFGYDGPIEQFSEDVFNDWNLGATTGNDGILVLVAWDEEMLRVELGRAYPDSIQPLLQGIIDDVFVPAFKDGRPEDAIVEGCDALIERIALADHEDGDMGADTGMPPPEDGGNSPDSDTMTDTMTDGETTDHGARRHISGENF